MKWYVVGGDTPPSILIKSARREVALWLEDVGVREVTAVSKVAGHGLHGSVHILQFIVQSGDLGLLW